MANFFNKTDLSRNDLIEDLDRTASETFILEVSQSIYSHQAA